MSADRYANFCQRYAAGDMPWDSGQCPPEIIDILAELPAGLALDLGCGTGTVMLSLLQRGWHADGVDFVERAIAIAREKLRAFPTEQCRLFRHDVTALDSLTDLRPPYDLVIDIGCGHGIGRGLAEDYAESVAAMLKVGGSFMLYASHPRADSDVGLSPRDVLGLFTPRLNLVWHTQGRDAAIGSASSWYRMEKRESDSLSV